MEAWTANGESVLPIGRKTRALLAILASAAPRPVPRARLAELLWSRRPEEQARASLRQEIHRLLESLQPAGQDIVRVARDHLSLRAELVWTDVAEVMRATVADPSALRLLDGTLMDEFGGVDPALDQWLVAERDRVRDRARSVAEALLQQHDAPEPVIVAAQQLLGIDRAHEGAWRALMRAHAQRSERRLAIQAYERCKAALAELLDAVPSPETENLAAGIRNGTLPSAASHVQDVRCPQPLAAKLTGVRLGVLPPRMIGTGEEEAHLASALAEEITAALARFRWLFLVSPSSLGQYGSRDEATLHRVFGIDFLLDGSVQRDGRRLRITLRLLDLRDGNKIVWAQRFDRQMDDLLSLQDEVAADVAAQVDPELLSAEGRRAAHCSPANSTAYDLVLRALTLMVRLRREDLAEAGDLLIRALEIDPDYAVAHAWRAFWCVLYVGQDLAYEGLADPASALAHAGRHAERAIMLDPQDARGLTIAGHVRAFLHHRPREALELHQRALSMNPNLAMAWGMSAVTHTYLGDWDEAARRFARYRRLSPKDPSAFFFDAGMALMEFGRRDYRAAIHSARRASELNPYFMVALRVWLAALGHAGLLEEAADLRARMLAAEPEFSVCHAVRSIPFAHAAEAEHFAAGLRLAGLREGETG